MFSPNKYVSVFSIWEDSLREQQQTETVEFVERFRNKVPIFVASSDGKLMRIDDEIFAHASGEMIFVNSKNWTVSLDRLRSALSSWAGESADWGVALYLIDPENGESARIPGRDFAKGLEDFEGWSLVVSEEDLPMLAKERSKVPIVNHSTTADLERAFKKWVSTRSDKPPTLLERENWYRENGITRERGRQLTKKFAPSHWSSPGRRKANSR